MLRNLPISCSLSAADQAGVKKDQAFYKCAIECANNKDPEPAQYFANQAGDLKETTLQEGKFVFNTQF
jgi:hypothetical protein